jgi:hypothetical protein
MESMDSITRIIHWLAPLVSHDQPLMLSGTHKPSRFVSRSFELH